MSDVEAKLGRRVAVRRKAAKLTQEQLAERVKVTPETISRLERGASIPSLKSLERIARAMGVELRDLFDSKRRSPADEALERLENLLRRRKVEEIELALDIVERLVGFLGHQRHVRGPNDP